MSYEAEIVLRLRMYAAVKHNAYRRGPQVHLCALRRAFQNRRKVCQTPRNLVAPACRIYVKSNECARLYRDTNVPMRLCNAIKCSTSPQITSRIVPLNKFHCFATTLTILLGRKPPSSFFAHFCNAVLNNQACFASSTVLTLPRGRSGVMVMPPISAIAVLTVDDRGFFTQRRPGVATIHPFCRTSSAKGVFERKRARRACLFPLVARFRALHFSRSCFCESFANSSSFPFSPQPPLPCPRTALEFAASPATSPASSFSFFLISFCNLLALKTARPALLCPARDSSLAGKRKKRALFTTTSLR